MKKTAILMLAACVACVAGWAGATASAVAPAPVAQPRPTCQPMEARRNTYGARDVDSFGELETARREQQATWIMSMLAEHRIVRLHVGTHVCVLKRTPAVSVVSMDMTSSRLLVSSKDLDTFLPD